MLAMILTMGVVQMVGVASVMPFMSLAAKPEVVQIPTAAARCRMRHAALEFTDPQRCSGGHRVMRTTSTVGAISRSTTSFAPASGPKPTNPRA